VLKIFGFLYYIIFVHVGVACNCIYNPAKHAPDDDKRADIAHCPDDGTRTDMHPLEALFLQPSS
jgi:hypothetical protein